MSKFHIILAAMTIFIAQNALANQKMGMESSSCMTVANACKNAGYRMGNNFWFGCMKPLLLGTDIKHVKVSSDTIKNCRTDKIAHMKKELQELESVR